MIEQKCEKCKIRVDKVDEKRFLRKSPMTCVSHAYSINIRKI